MKKNNLHLLAQITHVSLLLLTPILLCTLMGVWLDRMLGASPWIALLGAALGTAAAFRNLFVWNARMVRMSEDTPDPLRTKGADEDEKTE